ESYKRIEKLRIDPSSKYSEYIFIPEENQQVLEYPLRNEVKIYIGLKCGGYNSISESDFELSLDTYSNGDEDSDIEFEKFSVEINKAKEVKLSVYTSYTASYLYNQGNLYFYTTSPLYNIEDIVINQITVNTTQNYTFPSIKIKKFLDRPSISTTLTTTQDFLGIIKTNEPIKVTEKYINITLIPTNSQCYKFKFSKRVHFSNGNYSFTESEKKDILNSVMPYVPSVPNTLGFRLTINKKGSGSKGTYLLNCIFTPFEGLSPKDTIIFRNELKYSVSSQDISFSDLTPNYNYDIQCTLFNSYYRTDNYTVSFNLSKYGNNQLSAFKDIPFLRPISNNKVQAMVTFWELTYLMGSKEENNFLSQVYQSMKSSLEKKYPENYQKECFKLGIGNYELTNLYLLFYAESYCDIPDATDVNTFVTEELQKFTTNELIMKNLGMDMNIKQMQIIYDSPIENSQIKTFMKSKEGEIYFGMSTDYELPLECVIEQQSYNLSDSEGPFAKELLFGSQTKNKMKIRLSSEDIYYTEVDLQKANGLPFYFIYNCYFIPSSIYPNHKYSTGLLRSEIISEKTNLESTKQYKSGIYCDDDKFKDTKECFYLKTDAKTRNNNLVTNYDTIKKLISQTQWKLKDKAMVLESFQYLYNDALFNFYSADHFMNNEDDEENNEDEEEEEEENTPEESQGGGNNSTEGNNTSTEGNNTSPNPENNNENGENDSQKKGERRLFQRKKYSGKVNLRNSFKVELKHTIKKLRKLKKIMNQDKNKKNRKIQEEEDEEEEDEEPEEEEEEEESSPDADETLGIIRESFPKAIKDVRELSAYDCHYESNYDQCVSEKKVKLEEYTAIMRDLLSSFKILDEKEDIRKEDLLMDLLIITYVQELTNNPEAFDLSFISEIDEYLREIPENMEELMKNSESFEAQSLIKDLALQYAKINLNTIEIAKYNDAEGKILFEKDGLRIRKEIKTYYETFISSVSSLQMGDNNFYAINNAFVYNLKGDEKTNATIVFPDSKIKMFIDFPKLKSELSYIKGFQIILKKNYPFSSDPTKDRRLSKNFIEFTIYTTRTMSPIFNGELTNEEAMPKIYFPKEDEFNLCYHLDYTLDNNIIFENYQKADIVLINGDEYYECKIKTSMAYGVAQEIKKKSKFAWWKIFLIVLASVIFVLIVAFILYKILTKKDDDDGKNKSKKAKKTKKDDKKDKKDKKEDKKEDKKDKKKTKKEPPKNMQMRSVQKRDTDDNNKDGESFTKDVSSINLNVEKKEDENSINNTEKENDKDITNNDNIVQSDLSNNS
ncbi:MAG: hypothetical protein MJ252_08855, partial [archaeon]|nr:hypothetical protein [archaeon]